MISIKKQPNKDFVILNLSDPQLKNDEWNEGHEKRKILVTTVNRLIEKTKPDMITISGDLSWAGNDRAYAMLADFINGFGLPWAIVWGNHDNQDGAEYISEMVARYQEYSHFTYESGDSELGNGNYVIAIEEDNKPVEALIMMDSHNREPFVTPEGETIRGWGRVNKAQVAWYGEQIEELKAKGFKDATLILHIPIYGYHYASQAAFVPSINLKEVTVEQSYTDMCWNEGYKDSIGVQYEAISSYPAEDGMFDAILEHGITRHVIAGHDHVNNWIIEHEGIKFIYALKTGPGCYWNSVLNGGTVLKINSDGVYSVYHEYVDVNTIK